jgi:hypothetical protein
MLWAFSNSHQQSSVSFFGNVAKPLQYPWGRFGYFAARLALEREARIAYEALSGVLSRRDELNLCIANAFRQLGMPRSLSRLMVN